jgi:hypothetical protein
MHSGSDAKTVRHDLSGPYDVFTASSASLTASSQLVRGSSTQSGFIPNSLLHA